VEYFFNLLLNGPIFEWLNDLLHAEVTKMTVAFLIASEVHSRKVKKEFSLLRESIDHVARVMESRFRIVEERLEKIENKDVK
jgi:hypothetical protein